MTVSVVVFTYMAMSSAKEVVIEEKQSSLYKVPEPNLEFEVYETDLAQDY